MKCRRCGSELRPGSEICSNCGATRGRRGRWGYLVCRHCGQRVRASGRLCPACGAELRRSRRPIVLAALAIVAVAAGYYVLTQVVTIQRIQRQVEHLRQVSLDTLLPQPTPTVARTPVRATEVRPTPTRIPTVTPVPTPGFPYEEVELVAPDSGTELADSTVMLTWKAAGVLKEGEGYAVTLRYQAKGEPQTVQAWVHETWWRVPAEVHGKRDAASKLEWSVRVTKDASDGAPLSPPGATWTFTWR